MEKKTGQSKTDQGKTDHAEKDGKHYLVLSTRVAKQRQLAQVLSDRFPHDRGKIFIPEREYWVRKTKTIGRKPLFPGYIFALTDMNQAELHLFARENGVDIQTYVSDLAVREGRFEEAEADEDSKAWNELTVEETEFMDRMLDEEGVERMSVGYRDKGRYVVMEGPLKGWENHIADSDRHNREAYLNLSFRQHRIIVGLEQKPKSAFFPNGKDEVAVLEDGTEIDTTELSKIMMGNAIKD
ncbi:MAG: hypothetical protein IJ794_07935 [Lachnospiraceae bacterium]|nr:hypothetical protein [Lachnospiraceae bacterium]